jgi:hypothetical protein
MISHESPAKRIDIGYDARADGKPSARIGVAESDAKTAGWPDDFRAAILRLNAEVQSPPAADVCKRFSSTARPPVRLCSPQASRPMHPPIVRPQGLAIGQGSQQRIIAESG